MQIELNQSQLNTLDKHLGILRTRYEIEAAALAALGDSGQELAKRRLIEAKEAEALQDFFLNV